ncbi:MAG: RNA polymerase sigma factor [Candidatus Manganitrophaceae bacterium]|nr:MAG: RNA polymerase sigma factor [Candidatus Manganitrophaceae bacterium]
MPTDAELLMAAQKGDGTSLGILLERYRPRLHAVALALLGYGPQAEDAVHETFLIALNKLQQVREPGAVGGWLHAILRNVCRMNLRGQREEIPIEELPPGAEPTTDLSDLEEKIDQAALRDWIWAALSSLPETLRVTAMLRYFGSYTAYDEIAAILGIPVGTVRSRLSQVKLKLADALLQAAGLDHSRERAEREALLRFHQEHWKKATPRDRDTFLSYYADDLLMTYPDGETLQGRIHLDREVDGDFKAGTRILVRRILPSREITILEAAFQNPPSDPFRCPPGMTLVLSHRNGQTHRIKFYYAPRPPVGEE